MEFRRAILATAIRASLNRQGCVVAHDTAGIFTPDVLQWMNWCAGFSRG